nr:hypothetical protein [Tanacetum cinerariifolium]
MKGIKREYSKARTPQQNGVTKRKNMTFIEADMTMLSDSSFPITFWAEAVDTASYVLNMALATKSHNKTPYELLNGRTPRLDFMRPLAILNPVNATSTSGTFSAGGPTFKIRHELKVVPRILILY